MIVTLADAKAHCLIDTADQDAHITAIIAAAEDYLTRIGCDTAADPVPPSLKLAALLLVSHWLENREAAWSEPAREMAFAVSALTAPLREVSFG